MEHFDIVAFNVPDHHSLLYRRYRTKDQLLSDVDTACEKGANVISIRGVRENGKCARDRSQKTLVGK
jgi:hypothetical protein